MHSALYHGSIGHRRFAPRLHAFTYRIGMLYLDLDEQEALFALSPLAGRGRFAAFGFRETDYLPQFTRAGMPLREAVQRRLAEALGRNIDGPVRLLTQPRSWGLAFNPASFFYCFDREEQLQAILCEVSNTPWGERYHYVMPVNGTAPRQFAVAKGLHVSPFLPRDLEHRMRFSPPQQRLGIHIEDWQGELRLFDASLSLTRQPLTRSNLHRHLLAFPWMTAKTGLSIYWQALRLLLKRIPLFNHQAASGEYRVAAVKPQEPAHEKR
ncbi:DUF1365 domain-containing protein [Pseudomonas sp. N040]|uniref:DUF1365 domain-containing protein n=1 Tax=Pseudomonas sp. N040 TaxID=2785325 RepID=UPI0018A2C94A|nr:DUF1365 domain-containing protein [Pseudomonas sp. N040]MBF7730551.1 DUF1365 domain-containing protein [Pseudomonas sp. N040]MBW7014195.1 DUF1365 domain-containing protein [Pseudomonas sp. N040]